jgi:hypothetical protein
MIVSDYNNGQFKSDLLDNYNKFRSYITSHGIQWNQIMSANTNIQISGDTAVLAELRKQIDKYYSDLTTDQKASFDKCWAMLGHSKPFSWEDEAFQIYSTTVYLMKTAKSEKELIDTLAELDKQRQNYNSKYIARTVANKMDQDTLDDLLKMGVMTPDINLNNITDLQQLDYEYRSNIYIVAKLVKQNDMFELHTDGDLAILRNKCDQDWTDMSKIDPAGLAQSNMEKCQNVKNADFLIVWKKTPNGYKFYLEDRAMLFDSKKNISNVDL